MTTCPKSQPNAAAAVSVKRPECERRPIGGRGGTRATSLPMKSQHNGMVLKTPTGKPENPPAEGTNHGEKILSKVLTTENRERLGRSGTLRGPAAPLCCRRRLGLGHVESVRYRHDARRS